MKIFFDDIFAVTAPGLEAVCAEEISTILDRRVAAIRGGVCFSGNLEELYRVNLWSRIASRILVRVGTIKARDFPDLYRKVKRLPWGRFVRPEMPIVVRSSSRQSRLVHTERISETVVDAINGALGRLDPFPGNSAQTILARFENDICQLSVDSSGELLYRRGYRTEVSKAPLRETLAAGILKLLGWAGQRPLYDPMCGSGTFLIEGAQIAAGIAPGSKRNFAFQRWPKYRPGLWQNLVLEAGRNEREPTVAIAGSDVESDVVNIAQQNAERAAIGTFIKLIPQDISEVKNSIDNGLIICNPPYGLRIGADLMLQKLYQRLGKLYSEQFGGWQGGFICPSETLAADTGLDLNVKAELENGGVDVQLFSCDL